MIFIHLWKSEFDWMLIPIYLIIYFDILSQYFLIEKR